MEFVFVADDFFPRQMRTTGLVALRSDMFAQGAGIRVGFATASLFTGEWFDDQVGLDVFPPVSRVGECLVAASLCTRVWPLSCSGRKKLGQTL